MNNYQRSKEKILFWSASSLFLHDAVNLRQGIEEYLKKNAEVHLVYCTGLCGACIQNYHGAPSRCWLCQLHSKKIFKGLTNKVQQYPLPYCNTSVIHRFDYKDSEDLKTLVYRQCQIGTAVLSTYITITRNALPEITAIRKKYFDFMLDKTALLVDKAYEYIQNTMPDKIIVFNGRHSSQRPFYDAAKSLGIKIETYENSSTFEPSPRRIVYSGGLPHNIEIQQQFIERVWARKPSNPEKENEAKLFFLKKRQNKFTNDVVYTKDQQKGLLPKNFDASKKNIGIFTSSEDEFAALGKEFSRYALFKDQLEGIKYLLKNITTPTIHFYVRVHPNLKNVKYPFHMDYYILEKTYANVTVIPAWDHCDTYALMDAAEKIIVFGSTIGAEAAYWGKSVILLTACFYYHLGFCYIPKTKEEALSMTIMHLNPISNKNILKYAYYLMHLDLLGEPDYGYPMQMYQCSLCGYQSIPIPKMLRLFNSTFLMAILSTFIYFTGTYFPRCTIADNQINKERTLGQFIIRIPIKIYVLTKNAIKKILRLP